jgi:hypothetical protein
MSTAWLAIRDGAHYRRDAFDAGLKRCGFKVQRGLPNAPLSRDDLLVTWNRYAQNHRIATDFERRGCKVIVAENGYLGDGLPHSKLMALSISQHNGAGKWPQGGPERWAKLGVDLKPWRTDGETVVLPQRGIGPPGVAMPGNWPRQVERLGRVRRHPGAREAVPLDKDLSRAGRVITWGSGAAIRALAWGIPVFYAFPKWIGAEAATPLDRLKDGPKKDDAARLRMFERLAWAQWHLSEIESGEAIKQLLEVK